MLVLLLLVVAVLLLERLVVVLLLLLLLHPQELRAEDAVGVFVVVAVIILEKFLSARNANSQFT